MRACGLLLVIEVVKNFFVIPNQKRICTLEELGFIFAMIASGLMAISYTHGVQENPDITSFVELGSKAIFVMFATIFLSRFINKKIEENNSKAKKENTNEASDMSK